MQHKTGFVIFADLPVAKDLDVDFGDFSATSARITAATDAGRAFLASIFGEGVFEVSVRKSKAAELADLAARRGIEV